MFFLIFGFLFFYLIRLTFLTIKAKDQPSLLKAENRLIQFAAMMLVLISSIYIGFAIIDDPTFKSVNSGINIALAAGFLLFAIIAINKPHRIALNYLVVGFVAHTMIDLLNNMTGFSLGIMPSWYAYLCAIYDLGCAAICVFPIIYRSMDK